MSETVAKKQEQNYLLAVAMTLAIFCMGQIPGSIDAAISRISAAFHLSSTSGLYVTTVASLTSVAFSIVLGFVAGRRVGYKPLILFCASIEFFSALLPFLTENFVVLIILRGLFGIGFGGMMSMENTVATTLISEERRASVLGLGMFVGFGTNCLLQFIGGVLADYGWNYVFLNHLLLVIPYAFILIGCARLDLGAGEAGGGDEEPEQADRLSRPVYQAWALMLFVGIFIAPLLIGCSFLSEQIVDSATVAGVVAVFFSLGCMAGGLCFSFFYGTLGGRALICFQLMMAVGIVGCALAGSIIMLCIMIFVAGMGFSLTQSMCMTVLSLSASRGRIAFASAILMALFNGGMFLSGIYEEIVGALTGDALYMPLYIGAAVTLLLALLYALVPPLGTPPREAK